MSDLISRQAAIDALEALAAKDTNVLSNDCISRQAAIDAIHCNITVTGRQNAELVAATMSAFVDRIRALPSAQPEIIRCKDCKYYVIHTLFGRSQGWCERLCDEFDKSLARGTDTDDFCSYAERREG